MLCCYVIVAPILRYCAALSLLCKAQQILDCSSVPVQGRHLDPSVSSFLTSRVYRYRELPACLAVERLVLSSESRDAARKNKESGWLCAGCGHVCTLPGPNNILQHFLGEATEAINIFSWAKRPVIAVTCY